MLCYLYFISHDKKCPRCLSYSTKKNGKDNSVQKYLCTSCLHVFRNSRRPVRLQRKICDLFTLGGRTVQSLIHQFHWSRSSILSIIHTLPLLTPCVPVNSRLMIVMDCVYFGRGCCYLVARDWYTRRNIYVKHLLKGYETIQDYLDAVEHVESQGNTIEGIVIDGRRGVLLALKGKGYFVQMCQFHMKQIIKRYLTKNPHTQAGIDLKSIADDLIYLTPQSLTHRLCEWYVLYESFIKERTYQQNGKHWNYTHRRVRSAYYSLLRNLPHLFTFQSQRDMPNTTNSADGYFSHLKDKVRVHRGLKKDRKHRLIMYLIVRS